MFDQLTERLSTVLKTLSGRGRLSEDNIADTVRQVRLALLEADVALPVVKSFTDTVRARALGTEVTKSLTPGQAFIKVVHEELTRLMGEPSTGLNLRAQRPVVVMLAGLQGAGKTTTAGKLARWLIEKQKKKVLMVSTDVYRPAAILQLQTLAGQVGAGFAAANASEAPVTIAKRALTEAALQAYDVLLLDTAGRLHVDTEMMDEVKELDSALNPHEHLFVVDSMAGQDAVNAAKAFDEALTLTGVILTKTDGDARGGAALSVRQVTGKPILFVGTGEKSDALELFQPERIASRILGMGDVVSLVEQVQGQVDQEKAEKLAKKISKGKSFDLADLRDQLNQLQNMGGRCGQCEEPEASNGDHRLDDAAGAPAPGTDRWLPQAPHRSGSRSAAAGGQSSVEAVRPHAKNDEKARQGRNAQEYDAGHGRTPAALDSGLKAPGAPRKTTICWVFNELLLCAPTCHYN